MNINWQKLIANVFATFIAGAGAGFMATGTWQGAVIMGVTAAVGNQTGLHQTPPVTKPPAPLPPAA